MPPVSLERRGLVPVEVGAIVVIAIVYLVAEPSLPEIVPLFVAATASRWARLRSWGELAGGGALAIGVGILAGVVALALAVVAGAPLVEAALDRAVEWSRYPMVRGSAGQLAAVALIVGVAAIVTELVLRGWIVERALELGAGTPMAILLGALAEFALTPGSFAARLGGAVFGAGLAWMYVAGGRPIAAPAAAHVAFQVAALVLESLQWIG